MPEGTSNSLVNLGDITKPANTLIKKVSEAVGGLFAPYQIKRMAKAEAEAALTKTQSDIQITEIHHRAMRRWIEEEARKQKNMEDITNKAFPHLQDNADAGNMNDDWVANFFDKSRLISDGEMQELWASILAGEANTPGTFSKRTVNSLGDFEKSDAELFSKLCRFNYHIGNLFVPLIFNVHDDIYKKEDINYNTLTHLDNIGLIKFGNISGFMFKKVPQKFSVVYYGDSLILDMPENTDNDLQIGKVLLTQTGEELAHICRSKPVPEFMEYVKEKWATYLPKPMTG